MKTMLSLQAAASFAANCHRIACFVAEPLQGEGGDRHLSARFLGEMHELCKTHEALFVLDEVQTGVGATGFRWAYEGLALEPDVVAFAKKVQLGGVMAGRRVDDEPDNVFQGPGADQLHLGWRAGRHGAATWILQVFERDNLVEHAANVGQVLLGELEQLASEQPGLISNVRGRRLLCAVDLPTSRRSRHGGARTAGDRAM